MNMNVRLMVTSALFIALTAVATMFIGIKGASGYYHLGDGLFYAAALVLGPVPGALAGGLGGAIADMLTGYAAFAPWTLVIKGLTGWVIGALAFGRKAAGRQVAAMVAGALITIAGYALAVSLMAGWPAALVEIWGNTLQTGLGIAAALLLSPLLTDIIKPGSR